MAIPAFEGIDGIGFGGAEGGQGSEDRAGNDGDGGREEENAPIGVDSEREGVVSGCQSADEEAAEELGEADAE